MTTEPSANPPVWWVLRWLCVVPAAIGAWYLVLFLGLAAWTVLGEAHLDRLVTVFAGLSAPAVVWVAAKVAPSAKGFVAWAAYVLGAMFALYFASGDRDLYGAAGLALALGALALWSVHRSFSTAQARSQA